MLEPTDLETEIVRIQNPKANFPLLQKMFVEKGESKDWNLLHELHYKAEKLPIGPKFWKLTLEEETIGVLVTGMSKGLLKERHLVFPNLKPKGGESKIINQNRYVFINNNFRVISRFVIDTMYRGIGAGYRMMNLVSRMEGNKYMEIQSSMSKFNFFGQKAGFKFVKPTNALKFETGLRFFRLHFNANPQDNEAIIAEFNSKSEKEKEILLKKCKDFYYQNSPLEKTGNCAQFGAQRVEAMTIKETIKALQQITLASPMYGIWENPDFKTVVPQKLPLIAFDSQSPTEKLKFGENL